MDSTMFYYRSPAEDLELDSRIRGRSEQSASMAAGQS